MDLEQWYQAYSGIRRRQTCAAAISARRLHDPRQAVFALDHDIQNTSESNLSKYREVEAFAREQGVDFYPAGTGIGHQIMVEKGYVKVNPTTGVGYQKDVVQRDRDADFGEAEDGRGDEERHHAEAGPEVLPDDAAGSAAEPHGGRLHRI